MDNKHDASLHCLFGEQSLFSWTSGRLGSDAGSLSNNEHRKPSHPYEKENPKPNRSRRNSGPGRFDFWGKIPPETPILCKPIFFPVNVVAITMLMEEEEEEMVSLILTAG